LEPGRSPKIDKNPTFWRKVSAEERLFTEICGERCFSRFFDQFWLDFQRKIDVFLLIFLNTSCVFFNLATLTIVWFLHIESYVFIFRAFAFFQKNSLKIDAKPQSRKNIES